MPRPNPPHVFRKNGLYYLRVVIPADLRPLVGKGELRYSLKTGYRSEASHRAGHVAARLKALLNDLRGLSMSKFTKDQVRPLVEQYVHARLEDFTTANAFRMQDEIRATKGEELPIDKAKHPFWSMLKELRVINEERKKDRNGAIIARGEAFLGNEGFTEFLESPEFSHFCVGISTAEKKFLNYFLAILNEKRNPEQRLQELLDTENYHPRLPGSSHRKQATEAHQPAVPTSKDLISLSLLQMVQKYIEERREYWKLSTAEEYPHILSEFVEIVGDVEAEKLNKSVLRYYRETLQKLPRARGRKSQYRGKSVSDVLKMDYTDKVTSKTVNKHLLVVSGMLKWAVGSGYCAENYATGLQIKLQKSNPKDARSIWSKDELSILFSKENYPLNDKAHMFWLPIMGLLTGARIDELSQLRPCDIKIIDGIYVFDINDENGKRLKTSFSKRIVPIHPFLKDTLHLHNYAKRREEAGDKQLFPELFNYKSDCRKIASNHFSKYIRCHLKLENLKVSFHSFRHTVKQYLQNAVVEKSIRNELMGWQSKDVSDGVYGGQLKPRILLEQAVVKIPLEVDCSFLATSLWVTGKQLPTPTKPNKQRRIKWKT